MARHSEMTFGKLLQQHRRAARLTQEALAQRVGYSPNYISMLERGVRVPGLVTVDLLAEALQVGASDRAALEVAAQPRTRLSPVQAPTRSHQVQLIGR